jgi:hypothetical protein
VIVSQATRVDVIDPIAIQALESRLLGSVVRSTDEEYDSARRVQNLFYDRFPALVVRAADAADVIRAVEFARDYDLKLAVRSGGHSVAGFGTVDGGLVLDLSGMKAVSVDPVKQTAWVQPGAKTSDLIAATGPLDRRYRLGRHWWTHNRRRNRLDGAQIWTHDRQPTVGRDRDRRWPTDRGQRRAEC